MTPPASAPTSSSAPINAWRSPSWLRNKSSFIFDPSAAGSWCTLWPAMSMTPHSFAHWLDSYGQAWQRRNPQAAADLFAEDGTYQVTPFLEPMRGKQAILEYWTNVAQTPLHIHFSYELLAVTPHPAIPHC